MHPRSPAGRGYILIEVTIGGALIALLIAGLLTQIAQARTDNVIAGRQIIAAQLVQEKIERERALGFVSAGGCNPAETAAVIANQQGRYERTCTRTASTSETIGAGVGAVTVNYNTVTVTVDYETNRGTRTTEVVTRVYEQ